MPHHYSDIIKVTITTMMNVRQPGVKCVEMSMKMLENTLTKESAISRAIKSQDRRQTKNEKVEMC